MEGGVLQKLSLHQLRGQDQPQAGREHGLHFLPSCTLRSPASVPLQPVRPHTRPGPQGRMGQGKKWTPAQAQSPKSVPPKDQPGLGGSSPKRGFYTHQGRDRQHGEETPPGKYTREAAQPFHPHEMQSHETCYGGNKTGKEPGQGDWSLGEWVVPWPRQEGPDTVTMTHKPDTGRYGHHQLSE